MRRLMLAVCSVLSVTVLGCSLFDGKEGFLDRAATKDTREGLMIKKCAYDEYLKYCEPDRSTPECREHCG